ncbi:MAG: class I SAM-dependent methyltransferase [Pirellulales bacterium]|nr:class I SAM-dependent methyltransferase [Pirellulales bacterium]
MTEEARFAFGENWKAFLTTLDEERISRAIDSLASILSADSLAGQRFLDIGSGSGLFSLAAHRLGAEVVSLDYDSSSVGCTEELKRRFADDSPDWQIHQGSVLDLRWMETLGSFDVVYSWGVLHHTGEMDRAIEIAAGRTRPGGRLALAIYNDQGGASRRWLKIKQAYNALPVWLRPVWVALVAGVYESRFAAVRLLRMQSPLPFHDWKQKKQDRGMSVWHDWVDWVGGLPFEVAAPEAIILPVQARGFWLENLKTVGPGWGCNEYVFRRRPE